MRRLGAIAALVGASLAAGEVIGHVIFWVHNRRGS